ncbi:MAG: hypothetical protein K1X94_22450 [Sandaracinaceae bacterium]|nr:hypothetical protein [Sandaracinaceae bacterium]
MARLPLVVLLLVGLARLTAPSPAAAQALATCEGVSAPAELQRLGAELAQNGAWDSAVICFERLSTLAPDAAGRADALFNQGIALQSLGRHHEARDVFSRWMREHAATADDATRAEAARLFAMESSRVGTLELRLPATPVEVAVRVDGHTAEVTARPLIVEVDPGTHTVIVTAEGYTTFTWDGRTTDGGRESVEVSLVPLPSGGGSVADSPGFWVGMVLLAGAIGGGIALGVFLQDDAQLDARPGLEVIRL